MFRLVKRDKRRERITLTPLGGIVLGCLIVLAGSLIAMGWRGATHSLTPLTTPVPGQETLYPITWHPQMKKGPGGITLWVVSDSSVKEDVKRHYLEAFAWLHSSSHRDPSLVEHYYQDIPTSGGESTNIVGVVRRLIELRQREMEERKAVTVWSPRERYLGIMNSSPDGRRVYLVDVWGEGAKVSWRDTVSGAIISEHDLPPQKKIAAMIFDSSDGRWKVGRVTEFPLADSTSEMALYESWWGTLSRE